MSPRNGHPSHHPFSCTRGCPQLVTHPSLLCGAAVVVSGIVTYRVVNSARAALDMDNLEMYVRIQAHAVLKRVASRFPCARAQSPRATPIHPAWGASCPAPVLGWGGLGDTTALPAFWGEPFSLLVHRLFSESSSVPQTSPTTARRRSSPSKRASEASCGRSCRCAHAHRASSAFPMRKTHPYLAQ